MTTNTTTKQFTMTKDIIDNKVALFNEAIDEKELYSSVKIIEIVDLTSYADYITYSLDNDFEE